MDAISYTTARVTLSWTMAKVWVCQDHAAIIITRKSEKPVVMFHTTGWKKPNINAIIEKTADNAE